MPLCSTYRCLLDAEQRPMTPEESHIFMAIMMASPEGIQEMGRELAQKSQAFQILSKRLEFHNVNVELRLQILISSLCKTPGQVVMWVYTLFLMQEDRESVSFNDFCGEVNSPFAMGVPTDESYSTVWDAQKISRKDQKKAGEAVLTQDNWLDRLETWQR